MGREVRGVLDTSAVISRGVVDLPDEAAISTVTLAELHFGVQASPTDEERAMRLRRLAEIESSLEALPVDGAVARAYGALAHVLASRGRSPRPRAMDILIAATSQTHGVPLFTKDQDFEVFSEHIDVRLV
ncbi:MAG: PIN domain-containing protein [Actinomycetota bacterium]